MIRYSLLSPGRVAKQLDRFIAEKDVHEHEQIEWESLAGRECPNSTIIFFGNANLIQRT